MIKSSVWIFFVVSVVLALGSCDTVGSSIVAVTRRLFVDIYHTCYSNITDCHTLCEYDTTYLVAGQMCIYNSNLTNECSLAITPTGEPQLLRLTVRTVNKTSALETISSNNSTYTNATVILRSRGEYVQVNHSVCNISSLEVYRGKEQAIEINKEGFSLGSSGTIEVNEDQLAYNSTEYTGELYRMNLSCNSSDLPINGCLFFKVSGLTTITDAKFNCMVPGTVQNISECIQAMTTISRHNLETTTQQFSSPRISTHALTEEAQITQRMSNHNRLALETGSPLFYGLVVAGSVIILILLLCLIGVTILGCRRGCKRGKTSYTDKQAGQPVYEDLDIRNGGTTLGGSSNNLAYTNTMNGSGDPTRAAEQDFSSHNYQEIGATYQEIMPVVKDPNRLEWGVTNPNLFQPNSEQTSQEYSTLNHMGGQKSLNHCNELTTDSEQYAKLNNDH